MADKSNPSDVQNRRKRVRLLKKIIIAFIIIGVILPTILCIILFVKMNHLQKQMEQFMEARAQKEIQNIDFHEETVWADKETVEVKELNLKQDEIKESVDVSDKKKVYLTFDDGPSIYTSQILDICQKYNIKVTFFVVGKTGTENEELYRRIVQDGHSIGMHSFSHKYKEIYATKENFENDVDSLKEYIQNVTGVETDLYRFPGGSSNSVSKVPIEELITCLNERGIKYFDWNVSCLDATGKEYSARQIADNVLNHIDEYESSIVLMHDSGDKIHTVEALPIIIETLLNRGDIDILPITDETELVQHIKLK